MLNTNQFAITQKYPTIQHAKSFPRPYSIPTVVFHPYLQAIQRGWSLGEAALTTQRPFLETKRGIVFKSYSDVAD